jgi:myo-inositol-1(or 4)-monophosphatase
MEIESVKYNKLISLVSELSEYAKNNVPTEFSEKGNNEVVCEIDRYIEEQLKSFISEQFPNELIWGEESGGEEGGWLIDPIDGTGHYLHGLPLSSIALVRIQDNESVFSIVSNILTGDLFTAEKDKGSRLVRNGKEVELKFDSNVASDKTIVGWDHVMKDKSEANLAATCYQRCLESFSRTRMFGSGALSLCYLSRNYFHLFIKSIRKTKEKADIFAGLLVAQEAGALLEVVKYEGMDFYLIGSQNAIDTAKSKVLF